MKSARIPSFRPRLFLFFLAFLFGIQMLSVPQTQAQVFLEFTWTFEKTDHEGLLYVPTDKRPTMTVRILDAEGKMDALLLEKVDLVHEEDGTVRLICSASCVLKSAPEPNTTGSKR